MGGKDSFCKRPQGGGGGGGEKKTQTPSHPTGDKKIPMRKPAFFKLLVCAILCASTVPLVRAQTNAAPPAGAAPAFGGRGGGRGFGRGQALPPGPPAPVPPEVAIPRPTPAELAQMNADLQQFIATSPDKELLSKYQSLVAVQMPRDSVCIPSHRQSSKIPATWRS